MTRSCEQCREPIDPTMRSDSRFCGRPCRNRATAARRTRLARLGAAVDAALLAA